MFRPSQNDFMSPGTTSVDSDAPRYPLAWAALTYVLLTLTLGYPALTGGFLVTPISDQFIGGFPVRDFAAQSLKAGLGIPLWNPYLFGGMPYVAAMGVGDIYYPTALMRMLLPVDIAMTWGLIVHVVLAGITMYVFCRAIGLGFRASLVGGAAYMMCGPVAGLVSPGHDGKLFISALTPLALFLLLRGVRFGDLRAWGALAITVGLAVLSPHPQLLQYMLLLLGFFGLYLAFGTIGDARLERRVAIQRLTVAMAMVGLGFLIGAIQYDPFIQYIPWSPRAGGTTDAFAASYSMPPEEIVNMYLPEFTGILGSYWGQNNIHFHSEYLGAGVLLLATAAIGAKGSSLAMSRSFKLFILGTLVVSGLWALGGFTPFYKLILLVVPGTKYFRAPSTIMYISAFCVCLFAAIGAERILSGWFSKPFAIAWGAGAALVALLGVSGGLTNIGTVIANSFAPGTNIADYVTANASALAVGSVRSLFFVLIALAMAWGIDRRILGGRAAGIALLLGISVDLWSVERKYWNFSPRAAELYRSDATIDYLKPRRDSARVLTWGGGGDPMLHGDGLMVHQIRQAGGYHSNELGRYVKLGGREEGWRLDGRTLGWRHLFLNPSVRSLLNVRYLMTDRPPTDSTVAMVFGSGLNLVAGPARNAAGNMVYLYQLPGDNPPAWVATATLKVPDDAALATLQDPRFNAALQRSVAIVDTVSSVTATADPSKLPVPSTLTAQVHRPNHSSIVIDLSAPAQNGNMLIVSEAFYPGWNATIDGKPAATERTDYVLIGVPLTAGARKIELEFTSAASSRGKAITIASTIVSLLILGFGLVMRHRTGASIQGAA
jgi:hypothetical protein